MASKILSFLWMHSSFGGADGHADGLFLQLREGCSDISLAQLPPRALLVIYSDYRSTEGNHVGRFFLLKMAERSGSPTTHTRTEEGRAGKGGRERGRGAALGRNGNEKRVPRNSKQKDFTFLCHPRSGAHVHDGSPLRTADSVFLPRWGA